MSFMSPGSAFGNFMSGVSERLPGLIRNGSKIAKGFAGMFDPNGGWGGKINQTRDAALGFVGNGGNFQRMGQRFSEGDYGGAISSMGDAMGNMADFSGRMGNTWGGRGGRLAQQGAGYLRRGQDASYGAGAMVDSGRAMYGNMRDRFSQGRGQFNSGNYSDLIDNAAGGMQDMMNFGGQMGRQGGQMRRALTNDFTPRDDGFEGPLMGPRVPRQGTMIARPQSMMRRGGGGY